MSKKSYEVAVGRLGPHGSQARSGRQSVQIDTTLSEAGHAMDPVQLLLTAIGGSLLAALEALMPILRFDMRSAQVLLRGELSDDAPARLRSIGYVIAIDTEESDPRLRAIHENAVENAPVLAAVDPGVVVRGRVERRGFERGRLERDSPGV